MLLVYYSGSTHTTWKDHLRRTVHAATIKDSRPGHVFPFSVFLLFRKGGFIRLGGTCVFGGHISFRKAAMEFVGYGRGDLFCFQPGTRPKVFVCY